MCVLPYRDGVSLRHGSLHACLAHGRPIVTTHPAIATPDLRDGENVLLVPAGNVQAMASAVEKVAANEGLRKRLGAGASTVAKRFTWDRIATQAIEFSSELIG
jgi:glycosyltransferase involved in cell wall biosynthesis